MDAAVARFCNWLSATSPSQAFQNAGWFVPLVQTVHIASVAVFMISIWTISWRLIGLGFRTDAPDAMLARALSYAWAALALLLLTGTLLTITEPARELLNDAFRAKMIMVAVNACLLAVLQGRLRQRSLFNAASGRTRPVVRIAGAICLVLTVASAIAGRWIAYT